MEELEAAAEGISTRLNITMKSFDGVKNQVQNIVGVVIKQARGFNTVERNVARLQK